MKEFIIACVLLPFLMFFPVQFVKNQIIHYKIIKLNNIVHSAAQEARTKGYFTSDIINNMKVDIVENISGINSNDISCNVTIVPKYRVDNYDSRELIHYDVGIPVGPIVAKICYIEQDNDDENTLHVKGKVCSEVLHP